MLHDRCIWNSLKSRPCGVMVKNMSQNGQKHGPKGSTIKIMPKGGGTCPVFKKTEICHEVGILYRKYGKIIKIAIFGSFNPGNLKSAKNDIAYPIGIFFPNIFPKIVFLKKVDFDVIMTS